MADADTREKAQPDTGALKMGDFAVQASQKVQLDIDDAPFLIAPDDLPPPPVVRSEELVPSEVSDEAAAKARVRRKRRILMALAAVVVLALIFVVVWWFVWGKPAPTIPAQPEPTVIVVPSSKTLAGPPEFKMEFDPFMVEQRGGNEVHFLQARFAGISQSEAVIKEAADKRLVLRDSIYYYLRNKTHEYLVDPANTMTIKQDLLDIVNGSLSQGKMDDILLVNYIIK